MDLNDVFSSYKILEQIYLSMFTTAFVIFLYFCRGLSKQSKYISEWMGFYAIGIIIAGYGLGLGLYTTSLIWTTFGFNGVSFDLVTLMPPLLVITNGFVIAPIALFVIRTMREEIPKNTGSRVRALR